MKLTQKNFDKIIGIFNHKTDGILVRLSDIDKSMTNIINDLKWVKWMSCGISAIITINLIGGFI